MEKGSIPLGVLFFLILPLLATPAGMNIRVAKLITIGNVIMFFMASTALWQRAMTEEQQIGVIHDFVAYCVTLAICFFSTVPAAQASVKIVNDLQAGRSADSVLNHILKNRIAGAASLLEMLDDVLISGDEAIALRRQALDQLYLSMKWCASRQFIIDVTSNQYRSVIAPVCTSSFMDEVCFCDSKFKFETSDETTSQQTDGKILAFDKNMAVLACENAISNAKAHGDGNLVRFRISFDQGFVSFMIENSVAAGTKISTERLRELLKVQTTSPNASAEAAKSSSHSQPVMKEKAVKFSTQSGLKHIVLACRAANGEVDMRVTERSRDGSTQVQPQMVVLHLKFPAQLIVQENVAAHTKSTEQFLQTKSREETKSSTREERLPVGLKVCAIDDSKLICKGYEKVLFSKIQADRQASKVVYSQSRNDIENFLNLVNSPSDSRGLEGACVRPADVAILDQNLELPGVDPVFGTDLADSLRGRGYTGLIIIRSANSSEVDCAQYMKSGAVDGCIGKDGSPAAVAEDLRRVYLSRTQSLQESPGK